MASNNESPGQRSRQRDGKPRRRSGARWLLGGCVLLAVATAVLYWRQPLAGALLRAGLDRAGFEGATLSVTALSISRIELSDMRMEPELTIRTAEAKFDLSRLPRNPVTRVDFDGVRIDLTRTDGRLTQRIRTRREGAPPVTLRTLTDTVGGLPDIAVRDLALRLAPAGPALALAGSAEAARETGGGYAIQFALHLSGEIAGAARTAAIDGRARIAADAAEAELGIRTPDGAAGGSLTARADISEAGALVGGSGRLEVRDPVSLAGLAPFLEGTGGRAEATVRTMKPVSIGLDTPLDMAGLAAALQRAGVDGFRIEASIEGGSRADSVDDVDGRLAATIHGMPDASDALLVDGELSLRATRIMTARFAVEEPAIAGPFRLTRRDGTLTLVLPDAMQIDVAGISTRDGAMSVSPLAMTLGGGRTHALRVAPGKSREANIRLKLDVDATRVRSDGKTAHQFDVAPFTLRLVGTANNQGSLNAHLRIPMLSATEGRRLGMVDDLAATVRRSGTSTTGSLRGSFSAREGDKPVLPPIPVQSALSLWRDILTFDARVTLPGKNVATAKGRYDLFAGRGIASLALPPFRMTAGGDELRLLKPFFPGVEIISGAARAAADLAWDGDRIDGTAAVGIDDMALVFEPSGTAIEGLGADIRLDRLSPPRTPPGQTIRAKRIKAGVAFDDVALRFALVDGAAPDVPALRIESFETLFAGGKLSAAPTLLDSAADASQAVIAVNDVDLAALLGAAGLEGVSGTGRLSGAIPVRMAGTAVVIAGGRLAVAGPGILRVRSDAAKSALARGGADVALMLSALEDFHYQTLTLDIEKEAAGEGRIVLRTRGLNPAVRDGQPFVINLTVSGNVDRLAAVAAQALQLPNFLVRNMLPNRP